MSHCSNWSATTFNLLSRTKIHGNFNWMCWKQKCLLRYKRDAIQRTCARVGSLLVARVLSNQKMHLYLFRGTACSFDPLNAIDPAQHSLGNFSWSGVPVHKFRHWSRRDCVQSFSYCFEFISQFKSRSLFFELGSSIRADIRRIFRFLNRFSVRWMKTCWVHLDLTSRTPWLNIQIDRYTIFSSWCIFYVFLRLFCSSCLLPEVGADEIVKNAVLIPSRNTTLYALTIFGAQRTVQWSRRECLLSSLRSSLIYFLFSTSFHFVLPVAYV